MTNILDTVEPDAVVDSNAPCGIAFTKKGASSSLGTEFYSRETLEPAIERLLAEHRKQVLLEVAEELEERELQHLRNGRLMDYEEELRRMAEGGIDD